MHHVWNKETIEKSLLIILFLSAFLFVYEGTKNIENRSLTAFAVADKKEIVQFQETQSQVILEEDESKNIYLDTDENSVNGYIIQFKEKPIIEKKIELEKEVEEKEKILNTKRIERDAIDTSGINAINPINQLFKFFKGLDVSDAENKVKASQDSLRTGVVNHKNQILNSHNSFRNRIRGSGAGSQITGKVVAGEAKEPKILGEYTTVFNGIALDISASEVEEIRKLPEVKEVFPNRIVNVTLMDSVPLINADDVWNLGYDGSGVTIAIIDTGVDYTHPDLGGCLGSGCKVIKGYDFINNDNNPMDDYGHGTHVAGIAAGNGVIKGVAPDANLYAVKVLSASGFGTWSQVISGIEWSVDPDGDPLTDDKADIISMSLGGPGDPDDAVSQAVDNAVSAGVVAVISAGNSGPNYGTIGSPGTARKAITVGASDKSDVIASFSSRGPTSIGTVKPDIVAPGVSICSSRWSGITLPQCLDSQHGYASGTSMAAPHVSGLSALLLQKYPSLTPEQVKAMIVNNAINPRNGTNIPVYYDTFTQGAGRIDALKILNAPLLVRPSSFRFVIDTNTNVADNTFQIVVDELIPNQNINIESEVILDNSAVTASINPVIIQNLGETSLTITFQTSGEINFNEGIYSGRIIFKNNDLNLTIPFSLVIDYTAPIIYNVNVLQGLDGNIITQSLPWYTDDLSTSTIFYRKVGSGNFIQYDSPIGNAHTFSFDNLELGEYEYYITAINLVGLTSIYDNNGNYFRFTVLPSDPISSVGYAKVATIPSFISIIANDNVDFDNDGKKEFIIRYQDSNEDLAIYEHSENDNFLLVSSIDVGNPPPFISYYPSDFGDSDNDGLKELLVYGRTGNDFFTRLYEQPIPTEYPDHVSWEVNDSPGWEVNAEIADTDNDGKKEIIIGGQGFNNSHRIEIYENTGDNAYQKTYFIEFSDMYLSQSMEVADDLDNDGKKEILFGGLIHPSNEKIYMVESIGDNSYQQVWSNEILVNGLVGVQKILYTGDLDNDGKKEFIAGGLKAEPGAVPFYWRVFQLFEYTSNNNFEQVWNVWIQGTITADAAINIGDFDNDEKDELIINVGSDTYIFENVGDNKFRPVWYTQTSARSIGVMNYDNDGYEEILSSSAIYTCDSSLDTDNDGLGNCQEKIIGTDPNNPDTDGDNLTDDTEVNGFTLPNNIHTLTNNSFVHTNPLLIDTDGDGCSDSKEIGNDQTKGGKRDPTNPWDYFDVAKGPDDTGIVRINDIVAVVDQYYVDLGDPGYTTETDRSGPIGPNEWNLGPPDGEQRIDDILASVNSYYHDCVDTSLTTTTTLPSVAGVVTTAIACPDINKDNKIDVNDLLTVSLAYNKKTCTNCDLDKDGIISESDIEISANAIDKSTSQFASCSTGINVTTTTLPANQTTTTTLGNQTSNCVDSDGGKNIYVKGTASTPVENFTESCSSSTRLLETWCRTPDAYRSEGYYTDCPSGYTCQNGACVSQSNQTNQTTTTSSTTTTTTLLGNQTNQTTTTTLAGYYTCTDSDGGIDPLVKGTTTRYVGGQVTYTQTDSCGTLPANSSVSTVREWYCVSDSVASVSSATYRCSSGCQDGKCLQGGQPTQVLCEDSDGGQNIYQKGTATSPLAYPETDSCSSSTRLLEKWCRTPESSSPEGYYIDCPAGYTCQDGACK